jgi:hypothetical protein
VAITAAQWKRAVAPVLPDPTSWTFRNKIAYRRPVGWVLLGVFGEGSGWQRDQVYIWSLVMPLYVESKHLVLSYSQRVAPAGTFGLHDEEAFRGAVASAVAALPSEDQALRQLAAGTSKGSAGARVLLERGEEPGPEVDDLRAARNATAIALGIR